MAVPIGLKTLFRVVQCRVRSRGSSELGHMSCAGSLTQVQDSSIHGVWCGALLGAVLALGPWPGVPWFVPVVGVIQQECLPQH